MVPTGDDIEWAVQRMRSNRSGGPSGIRTEHLQQWLREAQKANEYIALVMGLVTITETDIDTVKESETEMKTDMETAVTGPLSLYYWKRAVVLM